MSFDLPLWWDSHVYIGMGKYIFSQGKLGLWEAFRPLIHPIILGAFWKLNFNPIFIGKCLDVIFSLLAIALTYKLGEKLSKNIAVLSSLIFSLLPLFISHSGLILTEPLAISFGLLGIYLFLKNETWAHYLLAGLFLGLSFLTKFPQGIFFASIFFVIIFGRENILLKIKKLLILSVGFIVPIVPYLFFNYLRYPNFLEPFISGSWIVSTATWLYGSGISYYFREVFLGFPILMFFFGYIYLFFKEKYYSTTTTENRFHITLLITT
ncbi:glycosyltransferase family 39 protein, partial [Candidatus Woesearchaeota archaeon]|nr:glycosyltransferase family 39 protein [Candidatus Woesearchaeota archaeon]